MSLRTPNFEEPESSQVINISPLIDVIFILLLFFIVTMTFADSSVLQIEKPEASAVQTLADKTMTVKIFKDGRMEMDSEILTISILQERILGALADGEFSLVINAHAALPVQNLVDVMDCAKACGVKKIFIASKRK